jgi:putative transposase
MAVHVVCGINLDGKREILAVEPMYEESKASYTALFDSLKARGLQTVWLAVSDAHQGLVAAVQESFLGCSWQRCKVHFMRNILAHVPAKEKERFAARLKQICNSRTLSRPGLTTSDLGICRPIPKSCRNLGVVGIFPSMDSYIRLVCCYLMEYSEDWQTTRCYIQKDIIEVISVKRRAA